VENLRRGTRAERRIPGDLLAWVAVMLYRVLADLVVVVHLAFIVFVAVGALLAWRWPRLLGVHAASLVWAVAIITIGFTCPLTPLEKAFREMAGEEGYGGGFVDRYVEDVVYPESLTPLLRSLAAVAITVGYLGVYRRRQRARVVNTG
jgi:hypothetical protein